MIRLNTARRIATNWHGGQSSALYSYASTGIYFLEYHLKYLQEIETDLHPEYNLHPGELSKKDEGDLMGLKEFFTKQGEANGLKTEWIKNEQYGYMVPYLTEDTPDELANKVKVIAYLK